jgi:hypothetical protein
MITRGEPGRTVRGNAGEEHIEVVVASFVLGAEGQGLAVVSDLNLRSTS